MTPGFPHESLDRYQLAREIARWVLAAKFPPQCGDLPDQSRRAAISIALNIAEAEAARSGPAGRNHCRARLVPRRSCAPRWISSSFHHDLDPVPDGDVFVHAGDMLRHGSLDEIGRFVEWLAGLPHRHKVLVAGNHDRCFEDQHALAIAALPPGTIYLQDTGVTLDGVIFWGSPWQPRYHDWAFNLERGAALRDRWERIPSCTDVLVTHVPPAGFGDRGPVPGREGCADLLEISRAIAPKLHLFGHIHQDGGTWQDGPTLRANVTTWECERGATVITLDAAGARV